MEKNYPFFCLVGDHNEDGVSDDDENDDDDDDDEVGFVTILC